jgi:hypothetical protein
MADVAIVDRGISAGSLIVIMRQTATAPCQTLIPNHNDQKYLRGSNSKKN